MELEIILNGVERVYKGDYHTLHNNDWNEIIRNLLDEAYSEESNYKLDI